MISNSEDSMNTLFATVLQFFMFHPKYENAKEIAQYALQHINSLASSRTSLLASLLPNIFDIDEKIVAFIKSKEDGQVDHGNPKVVYSCTNRISIRNNHRLTQSTTIQFNTEIDS